MYGFFGGDPKVSEELLALHMENILRVFPDIILILVVYSIDSGLKFSFGRSFGSLICCILWVSVVVTSRHLALGFVACSPYLGNLSP